MTARPRLIYLARAGTCEMCGQPVQVGARAWWRRGHPLVICLTCRPGPVTPSVANASEADEASTCDGVTAISASGVPADASRPAPPNKRTLIEVGIAGGSAMREHDRRHSAREERIRRRWGRLSGLVLAMTSDPASTRVWERGSVGESKLAAALGTIEREDVIFLHDRRVPRTRGNIDHLVIAPSGIYVVDAKRYSGEVCVRDVSGLFRPADRRLFVGGRDRSKLARDLGWQVDAVRAAMGGRDDVPVTPVLCFIDAEWPLFGAPDQFEGVRTEGPRSVRKLVTRAGPLTTDDVVEIAVVLSQALPAHAPSIA